jgi:hypothetical protein
VQFNGTVASTTPGQTELVFALYKDQADRIPLWQEAQSVKVDAEGRYAVVLGGASADGIPADVFANGEARWLGVTARGEAEQPRVLLTSVPYAMKAADAETLGGLPASAFVREGASSGSEAGAPASGAATGKAAKPEAAAITASGAKSGYLPVFTDATGDLGSSLISQTTKNVGIGTTSPANPLSVAGVIQSSTGGFLFPDSTTQVTGVPKCTTAGQYPQWSGTSWTCVTPTLKAGTGLSGSYASGVLTLNTDTTYLQQRISGTCSSGSAIAAIAQGGTVTCHPTAGGVTSVASGAGLTGGPITSSGTLSIAKGGVTNAMLANPSLGVSAGTGLSGGGTVALGGTVTLNNAGILGVTAGTGLTNSGGQAPTLAIDTTVVPRLDAANTFSANQSISGNLGIDGNLTLTGSKNGITFPDGSVQTTAASGGAAGIQIVSSSCNLNFNGGNFQTCSASCPSGTVVLSGGGNAGGYSAYDCGPQLADSWPATSTSWGTGWSGCSGATPTVTVYAICMKDSSSKSSVQSPTSSVRASRTYTNSARRLPAETQTRSTSH